LAINDDLLETQIPANRESSTFERLPRDALAADPERGRLDQELMESPR